jgi:formate C-acetyltransferase
MDFNVIDKETLIRAQKDPENYKNIVVRVCGYSALFNSLDYEMQNEIIERVQR